MKKIAALALTALLLASAACADDRPPPDGGTPSPEATEGTTERPNADPLDADPETIARGLEAPWDVAFAGDDLVFVTERPGRVRLIRDDLLEEEPVAEIHVAGGGEGGLLGIAIPPGWPDASWVYLYYTHPSGENRVARFPFRDGRLEVDAEEVIVGDIPAASNHNGGRIGFGPDGSLYVTTGDAGHPENSVDTRSLAGKILRVDPEGDVPADQPFEGTPVWAYGLRNPQGFAWDHDGRLYVADHGPTGEFGLCCRDELNLVEPGSFQGWPFRSGDVATGAGDPPEQPAEPVADSGDETWAPSGIAFLAAAGEDRILMANLRGSHLRGFAVAGSDPREVEDLGALVDGWGRLRDVDVGPDGCVYLVTSNRDGRGDPSDEDDRVLRFCG